MLLFYYALPNDCFQKVRLRRDETKMNIMPNEITVQIGSSMRTDRLVDDEGYRIRRS